jgi:hypothetical protein
MFKKFSVVMELNTTKPHHRNLPTAYPEVLFLQDPFYYHRGHLSPLNTTKSCPKIRKEMRIYPTEVVTVPVETDCLYGTVAANGPIFQVPGDTSPNTEP